MWTAVLLYMLNPMNSLLALCKTCFLQKMAICYMGRSKADDERLTPVPLKATKHQDNLGIYMQGAFGRPNAMSTMMT